MNFAGNLYLLFMWQVVQSKLKRSRVNKKADPLGRVVGRF